MRFDPLLYAFVFPVFTKSRLKPVNKNICQKPLFGLISFMIFSLSFLDSMILKNRLEEAMPSRTDTAWSNQMRSVVDEFRKGAEDCSDDEIESIVDEAVNAVRKAG
jgi:hypothetical protein